MPDYSKGKIYMIEPICEYETGDIYIGSTTRPLSERMNEHRSCFKINKKNSVNKIFEKYGLVNCKIILIENYSCLHVEELRQKEGEHQRLMKCINKKTECRTDKEYQIDNADKLKKQKAEYYLNNKVILAEKRHQYYLLNKK